MKKSILAVLTVFALTFTSCGSSTTTEATVTNADSCAVKCDTACAEVSTVVATSTVTSTETVVATPTTAIITKAKD